MNIQATYLGMSLDINDLDVENLAFFKHCAAHDFHLQKCCACGLLRYPPTTACPWCAHPKSEWTKVEGKGAVHSYTEVTTPSTGIRAPCFTITMSPGVTSSTGISTSRPPRAIHAVLGSNDASSRSASPVRARALASNMRPINISVTITAADSKYTGS